MIDLRERFERDLDRVAGPPAWREVVARSGGPDVVRLVPQVGPRQRRGRRLGTVLLAATLGVALVAAVVFVQTRKPDPEPPIPGRFPCAGSGAVPALPVIEGTLLQSAG